MGGKGGRGRRDEWGSPNQVQLNIIANAIALKDAKGKYREQ